MCDEPLETCIVTEQNGTLAFQDWLVHHRAQPLVREVLFHGDAQPTPQVLAALGRAELIVFGPSNPYVSVDPILSLPGLRSALAGKRVVAISPLVAASLEKDHHIDPAKIRVIHNAIDLEAFTRRLGQQDRDWLKQRYGIPKNSFVVGSLSRLVRDKGHEYLIEAVRRNHVLV